MLSLVEQAIKMIQQIEVYLGCGMGAGTFFLLVSFVAVAASLLGPGL